MKKSYKATVLALLMGGLVGGMIVGRMKVPLLAVENPSPKKDNVMGAAAIPFDNVATPMRGDVRYDIAARGAGATYPPLS